MWRDAATRARRVAPWLPLALALSVPVLPVLSRPSSMSVLVTTAAVAIAAIGLDVLVGRAGQLSLAHAALLGFACFTTINVGSRDLPWPMAVLAAVAATVLVTTAIGLLGLRIRGLQIAVTTLALQIAAESFVFTRPAVTAVGREIPRPGFLESFTAMYVFAVAVTAGALVVVTRVGRARYGRWLDAVRETPGTAVLHGVDPALAKLGAYALSGALVGLGGALYALKEGSVSGIDAFNLRSSLVLVAIVVVGGTRSAGGIVLAAVFVVALPTLLPSFLPFLPEGVSRNLGDILPTVLALTLVASVLFAPRGIGGMFAEVAARLSRLLPDDAATTDTAGGLGRVPRDLRLRGGARCLLDVRGLTVRAGETLLLDGVSLEVRRTEVVGLGGESGAGRSVLLDALCGLRAASGSARLRGREMLGADPRLLVRSGLARTFADPTRNLPAGVPLLDAARLACDWLGGDREARARAALDRLGLTPYAGTPVGELPLPAARRAGLAAALAAGADLVLLEEPSAGLSAAEAIELAGLLRELRDDLGLTVLVADASLPFLAACADYSYWLAGGRVVADGPPDQIVADARMRAVLAQAGA